MSPSPSKSEVKRLIKSLLDFDPADDPPERARVIRTGEREPISTLTRQLVYRRDKHTCQRCGGRGRRLEGALQLDHIIPWSAGGSDRSDNLRTLCLPCNTDRSNFVSKNDRPAVPIVGICLPCLAAVAPRFAAWYEQPPRPRIEVYCGHHSGPGWALEGWHIL